MAAFTLQLPQVTDATLEGAAERRRIIGYLYQLSEQLRYTLAHLDDENISPGGVGLPSLSVDLKSLISSKASGEELRTAIEQTANAISLLASRDTTDALGVRLTSAESSLTVQADQIQSKVAQTDFDALGVRVGDAESSITQQAGQIRSKVAQTDFDALGSRVGAAESTITQQAGQIQSKVAQTDFQTGVGGANLLRTDKLYASGQAAIVSLGGRTYYNNAPKGIRVSPMTGDYSIAQFADVVLKRGQKYTLSFWAWWYLDGNTTTTSMNFRWNLLHGSAAGQADYHDLYCDVLMSQGLCVPTGFIVPRGTPTKFVYTFELPSAVTDDYTDWRLRFVSMANSVNIFVSDVKLEQGLCATAWSDSPDVVNVRLTEAESTITQQAGQIQSKVAQTEFDALGTRVSAAESTITQQAAQIQSKVSQTVYADGILVVQNAADAAQSAADAAQESADALGARVSTAESTITQQAAQIQSKVAQTEFQTGIGGANLLRLDKLSANNQASIVTPTRTYYSTASKGIAFAPLTSAYSQARYADVTLRRGQKYTLSFWAWWYLDAGTASTSMNFQWNLQRSGYDLYSNALMGQGICTPTSFVVPRATPTKFAFTFELPNTVDGDYTDWSLRFVSLANTVNVYVRDVKLEQGLCATSWSDSPEATEYRITAAESSITQQAGQIALRVTETDVTDLLSAADSKTIRTSAVTIDADGIEIESTGTIGLKSGGAMRLDAGSDMAVAVDGDAKLTIDDQGLSADVVRAESISAPNLILRQPGGAIPWRGSLQATLDSMGKYLGGTCTITAQADANGLTGDTGAVTVSDFVGGYLYINLTGVTLAHPLNIMNCGSLVMVYGTAATPGGIAPQAAGTCAVQVVRSTAQFSYIRITGAPRTSAAGGTQKGIYATYGANVFIGDSTIERTTARAIDASYGCQISLVRCRGGQTSGTYTGVANLGYMAVMENNCTLSQYSTVPSSVQGVYSLRGAVYGTATQLDSEGVTPVVTILTLTYTANAYGRLTLARNASIGTAQWSDGAVPRQGIYQNMDMYGCWILGNAGGIAAALSGKTITGMSLKLERTLAYGLNEALNVELWSHAWTSMPTYGADANPATHMERVGDLGTIDRGQTCVFDLASVLTAAEYAALKTGLQSGTIKGFGLLGGNPSGDRPFLQMSGVCELTVTYTG